MNSSSAASMMAARRSAERAARLDAGFGKVASGKAGVDGLTGAAFSARRRLAGIADIPPLMRFAHLALAKYD
jgi:hypothetical protein